MFWELGWGTVFSQALPNPSLVFSTDPVGVKDCELINIEQFTKYIDVHPHRAENTQVCVGKNEHSNLGFE